jgi:hypothetical protein
LNASTEKKPEVLWRGRNSASRLPLDPRLQGEFLLKFPICFTGWKFVRSNPSGPYDWKSQFLKNISFFVLEYSVFICSHKWLNHRDLL